MCAVMLRQMGRAADHGGCAVLGVGLKLLYCRCCGFESCWGHRYQFLVLVVCCVGSDLCYQLNTRTEEYFRLCVCVFLNISVNKKPQDWGSLHPSWAVAPQKWKTSCTEWRRRPRCYNLSLNPIGTSLYLLLTWFSFRIPLL
jgi:hypothetical protein